MDILQTITQEFNLHSTHAKNIVSLLDEGNTVPFIARYRKEMTGACDDQVLRAFSDRLTYLRNLEKRKEEVSNAITEQGKMTEEIRLSLVSAVTLTEVEDIYRPYKQKRKTRASVAIAKGLQPLADAILLQDKSFNVLSSAEKYITEEVPSTKDAIDGARDIIAEIISDDATTRKKLRNFYLRHGEIVASYAKGKEELDEKKTYGMYANYREPVSEIKGHRVLALNRGEKEEFLKVSVEVDADFAKRITASNFLKDGGESSQIVKEAAEDGYERLIAPSVEREIRAQLFDDARTYVQPDISVICRKDILDERGCKGAPDLVVEIVSPSNASHDYITKMVQYQKAGVREYWIVDSEQHMTTVVNFENAEKSNQYTFEETIVSGVLEGLGIQVSELLTDF